MVQQNIFQLISFQNTNKTIINSLRYGYTSSTNSFIPFNTATFFVKNVYKCNAVAVII